MENKMYLLNNIYIWFEYTYKVLIWMSIYLQVSYVKSDGIE